MDKAKLKLLASAIITDDEDAIKKYVQECVEEQLHLRKREILAKILNKEESNV